MKQTQTTLHAVKACISFVNSLPDSPLKTDWLSAVESGSFEKLFDGSIINPAKNLESCYPSIDEVRLLGTDYQIYNLLRKYPFKGVDRKKAALKAFEEGEQKCRDTNERLRRVSSRSAAWNDIESVRVKIARLLGPFKWDLAERGFAWGPGATTRLKNKEGDAYFKFRGKPETTLFNLPLAVAAVGRIPLWFGSIHPLRPEDMFTVVAGSKVTTVPKDAKTDRTIAIEPCMNMFVQKGIGSLIRNRLRRVGIDLNDQSRNQGLALEGSRSCHLATIDLSAASDTISDKLVELVTPDDWLTAMKRCRSDRYILASQMGTFEKFSTMGNGLTFEYESLLFWAITSVAVERTCGPEGHDSVSVYGDDIICPVQAVDELFRLLRFFGFTPNEHKSYWKGWFRESCGKHYFAGHDVTPFYLKDGIDQPLRKTWWANSIARWISHMELFIDTGWSTRVSWLNAIEQVPEPYRLHIPDGVGDGGLVSLRTVPYMEVPDEFYSLVRSPKQGKYVKGYQAGYDYMHWVEQKTDTRSRDPSDTPYLLAALYRERDSLGYVDRILAGLGETPKPSGLIAQYKVKRVAGWSSSWDHA